jgi:hypothetical protein
MFFSYLKSPHCHPHHQLILFATDIVVNKREAMKNDCLLLLYSYYLFSSFPEAKEPAGSKEAEEIFIP